MDTEKTEKYNKGRREKYRNNAEFRKMEKIRKKLWYEENREKILDRLAEIRYKKRINDLNINPE